MLYFSQACLYAPRSFPLWPGFAWAAPPVAHTSSGFWRTITKLEKKKCGRESLAKQQIAKEMNE